MPFIGRYAVDDQQPGVVRRPALNRPALLEAIEDQARAAELVSGLGDVQVVAGAIATGAVKCDAPAVMGPHGAAIESLAIGDHAHGARRGLVPEHLRVFVAALVP